MATNMGHSDADVAGASTSGTRLPPGVIEELLASPRRRLLLTHLYERREAVPVDDLATLLASKTDSGDDDVSRADRRRARTEIYQEHLPKLTATGVVTFDSLLGSVALSDNPALSARLATLSAADRSDCGTKDK